MQKLREIDLPNERGDKGLPVEQAAERFVYREARLLDEWRLEEWLQLWAEDGIYWVPANGFESNPQRHVSLVYDDRNRLEERVYRLSHADAHSQDPRSRTTHYLTGLEVVGHGSDEISVDAAELIVEVRRNRQETYGGRVRYVLRSEDEGLRMTRKTVFLTRNDSPLGNLTFIV